MAVVVAVEMQKIDECVVEEDDSNGTIERWGIGMEMGNSFEYFRRQNGSASGEEWSNHKAIELKKLV